MALAPIQIFEARQAAQYTGSNAADLNNAISDFTVVSQNAQGLTFTSGGQQYTVAPNGYVAWYQGEVSEVFQNQNDFEGVYQTAQALSLNHVHDLTLTTGTGRMAE